MQIKSNYEKLGTIVDTASNGLSVFRLGEKEGRISGGAVGDIVVKSKDDATIKIISANEWKAMPKDEEEAAKEEAVKQKDFKDEIIDIKLQISQLREQVELLKGNVDGK